MAARSGRTVPVVTPRHWGLRLQKHGQLPAPCGGGQQLVGRAFDNAVRPAGQRDAGPLHLQRPGVSLTVGRVVQHGQRVVEQVHHSQPQPVQVGLGLRSQVGPGLLSVTVIQQRLLAFGLFNPEPSRET